MFDIGSRDIKYISGVGPQRADILNKELEIFSMRDLIYYFPYKYVDRSRIYRISEIDGNMPYIQLKGQILSLETQGEGRQKRLIAHFSDGSGVVDLVWFQGIKFVTSRYKAHEEYIVFGKPTVFNGRINIAHPDIDKPDELKLTLNGGLQPYYNTTEKMKRCMMSSHVIAKIIANVLNQMEEPLAETLPERMLAEHKLMPLTEALRNVHFPTSPDTLRRAQYRLKFEELFYVQLAILRYTKDRRNNYRGYIFRKIGDVFNTFYTRNLPFQLTGAQKRVLKEIREDVATGRQMNRLLQGDVGSGKTLVALMSMLMALDNGYQACLMAPTEILANQHFDTIRQLLYGMNVRVELLTGSIKGKRRETILHDLLTGDINILIGTHALIEDTVQFSSLGFVVIDEQHRFGVAQRARLWHKNTYPPHILVMTATPIPRTLAMTLYGDLEVSVIDELPPGRKPVKTIHQFDNRRESLYAAVRKQLEEGRQVYIVYPLIKESEKIDLKNLEEGYVHICDEFSDYKVCKVHGKMKPAEKDEQMQLFVSGEARIMVATTVIEVGVNVPNASVMIIENAERFGLSQLHQLRGRVGRGADQSYCILVTGYKMTEDTRKRIEIMVQTNDGFEIAEADLKLRGPGDLEGTQQSGIAFDLKIADIVRDGQLLEFVRRIAADIVEKDPTGTDPQNDLLWQQLRALRKNNVNWAAIS
jgi:ATP-dependent DNA helicase RecG